MSYTLYIKDKSTGQIMFSNDGYSTNDDPLATEASDVFIQSQVKLGRNINDFESSLVTNEDFEKQLDAQIENEKTYTDKRKEEYPVMGDQFDMLWHAIDDGTLDKTSDFYTALKAVKDKYPKA